MDDRVSRAAAFAGLDLRVADATHQSQRLRRDRTRPVVVGGCERREGEMGKRERKQTDRRRPPPRRRLLSERERVSRRALRGVENGREHYERARRPRRVAGGSVDGEGVLREVARSVDESASDVEALRAAAVEIANQDGRGLRRRPLLNLGGRRFGVSILRPKENGEPVVVVLQGRLPASPDLFAALTVREREVATLVARGLTDKRIAATLGISLATVKDHVHRILVKSGLETRAAVAAHWHRR